MRVSRGWDAALPRQSDTALASVPLVNSQANCIQTEHRLFFFFFLGMNDVLPLGTDTFAHLVLPQGPAVHVSIKRSDDATASQDQNSSVSLIAPDWYCLRWYQDLAQTGQDGPGSATQQFCLRGKASQTLCGLSPNPAPVALISFENSG